MSLYNDQSKPIQFIFPKFSLSCIALVLLILSGVILTFLTPYFQIPDEPAHLCRAYQISEGVFTSPVKIRDDGKKTFFAEIPQVFFQEKYTYNLFSGDKRYSFDDISFWLSEPVDYSKRITPGIHNTGQYTPLVYFPQAAAAYIVRSLGGTAGQIFYAMRLGAALFTALCIFLSIRLLPEKGLLIFVLSMMPMFLAESASISADAVTYGVCFLVSAYILSLRRDDKELTGLQIILLICMAAAIGLAKQIYGTILLLYFLIPYKKLGNRRRYAFIGCLILCVCIASSLAWTYFTMIKHGVASTLVQNADPEAQMKYILSEPAAILVVFLRTTVDRIDFWAASFVGILGWLQLTMPLWSYPFYAVLLIVGAVYGNLNLSLRHRLIIFLGVFPTIFAMLLFEYLTWTQPEALIVAGIQGRYFIPIALMALSGCSFRGSLKHERVVALVYGILSLLITAGSTYLHFYA